MKTITTINIDLAKNSFSVYGVNAGGKPVLLRILTRAGIIRFFANIPACLGRYGSLRFFRVLGQKC